MDQIINSDLPNLTWTIPNFSTLTDRMVSETKEFKFSNKNIQWYLMLYPIDEKSKNYISLYLFVTTQNQIHTYFKYKLEDTEGKPFKFLQSEHIFPLPLCWGFEQLILRNHVLPLKNDTLVVKCWINMMSPEERESIEYNYNDLHRRLTESLNELLITESFSDVLLEANDGNKFSAHKCILAACSPVFKAMFTHEMKESQENKVKLKDEDSIVLKALLDFIYANKFNEEQSKLDELLIASDKYQINILKNMCETKLCHQLTVENTVNSLILAYDYHAKRLKMKAMDFIAENLQTIIQNNTMENLNNPDIYRELLAHISEYKKN